MADPVERLLFPAAADAGVGTDEGANDVASPPDLQLDVQPPPCEALHLDSSTADELVVSAKRKLTLRCGKSSITLHPNGKIVLRGEYILSDAEGVNRINGGRIELN